MMLNKALIILVFGCLISAAYFVFRNLDVEIEKFHIRGNLTAKEQIRVADLLGEQDFGGILSVDLDEVRLLLDGMGWARDVTVRRVWPAILDISLVKETPVARWGEGMFISPAGNLLELPDTYPKLPAFAVGISSPREAMKVFRLVSHLAALSQQKVTALRQDIHGGWRVRFNSGIEVFLGTGRLSERMQRFNKVFKGLRGQGAAITYMDLRYHNGVAVRYENSAVDEVWVASNG